MTKSRQPSRRDDATDLRSTELRIIGGRLRGRKLTYHGDRVTRPMKDRTREAIFNLVSTAAEGHHAIDLFAGTGALGLEALSRGATGATFIEHHVPTAKVLQDNIQALELEAQSHVLVTSAFLWGRRDLPRVGEGEGERSAIASTPLEGAVPPAHVPWLVFCSPPYSFYRERWPELHTLLSAIRTAMPSGSVLVVETDELFDMSQLIESAEPETTEAEAWRQRTYAPAVVAILGPT